jgi:hypothetical protein
MRPPNAIPPFERVWPDVYSAIIDGGSMAPRGLERL